MSTQHPPPKHGGQRSRLKRVASALGTLALASGALTATSVMTAAPAAAVTQNGYVFNDAWTMTGDNVTTQYSPTNGGASYHSAETLLPSRLGGVEVEASFAENSDRSPLDIRVRQRHEPGCVPCHGGELPRCA
ncbi:hypothetical protein GCM10009823_24790 [Brevibacterium salitolerans]|uniref:Uncharacterized protein n=1 Tax=Brevibacterium salitolerans TaxID=1403566 RepID=A0ABN2X1D0_9MICO